MGSFQVQSENNKKYRYFQLPREETHRSVVSLFQGTRGKDLHRLQNLPMALLTEVRTVLGKISLSKNDTPLPPPISLLCFAFSHEIIPPFPLLCRGGGGGGRRGLGAGLQITKKNVRKTKSIQICTYNYKIGGFLTNIWKNKFQQDKKLLSRNAGKEASKMIRYCTRQCSRLKGSGLSLL